MEYRQRAGILLEAALRLAISLKSYRLTATIIEAVTMFRLGMPNVSEEQVNEYEKLMRRQHVASLGDDETAKDLQCLPRLQVLEKSIETAGEDEIATGDTVTVEVSLDRLHAEGFTRQKMAGLQKQGLPPQLALANYIEAWWVLVRAIPVGSTTSDRPTTKIDQNSMTQTLDPADVAKFESQPENVRLYTAWPMLVQNIAQKTGTAKVKFTAPSVPGKYQILISLKSQDFLGADQDVEFEVDVVDAATVERKNKEEQGGEAEEDEEPKKDK